MPGETITPDEFEAALPRLGRLTLASVNIARSVLIDGLGLAEAGRLHGTSRQRVNAIVQRFRAEMQQIPKGWQRVEVWLPNELADRVKMMAEKARADYLKARSEPTQSA